MVETTNKENKLSVVSNNLSNKARVNKFNLCSRSLKRKQEMPNTQGTDKRAKGSTVAGIDYGIPDYNRKRVEASRSCQNEPDSGFNMNKTWRIPMGH